MLYTPVRGPRYDKKSDISEFGWTNIADEMGKPFVVCAERAHYSVPYKAGAAVYTETGAPGYIYIHQTY